MGWESFDVVTFDLGPLLQGQRQPNLKMLITSRILILYVFYYCFYMFAVFGDTPPADNKASGICLVATCFTRLESLLAKVGAVPASTIKKLGLSQE